MLSSFNFNVLFMRHSQGHQCIIKSAQLLRQLCLQQVYARRIGTGLIDKGATNGRVDRNRAAQLLIICPQGDSTQQQQVVLMFESSDVRRW